MISRKKAHVARWQHCRRIELTRETIFRMISFMKITRVAHQLRCKQAKRKIQWVGGHHARLVAKLERPLQ